ncbi:MAG: adenylate cyclase [Hapalosiphonaceae cyanobacterium JJU2]|nr:MAG: adenylate cyclase [Hapalosiphonaceae cyanobacterium JJU2]
MRSNSQIRILFLTSEPNDTPRLRVQEELREIQQRLLSSLERERFSLHYAFSARPTDISQAILYFQPQIVHFSGHGASTGELCFENDLGKRQLVEPQILAELFSNVADIVECVLLNACYSDIQARAISEHIPFVIGTQRAIGDQVAIAFAVGFYTALGGNCSYEDAHELGCTEIKLAGFSPELIPVLRKRIDQSSTVFYLERPTIEKQCYEYITQPGSLIRIKAPQYMGKTRLMSRIVDYAKGKKYQTVTLDFELLIDATASNNIGNFLCSFCVAVGGELGLSNQLDQYWNQGADIDKTTNYFQKYLLTSINNPLVLALNHVDLVFEQGAIANNFCAMLRDWHNKARRDDATGRIWKRLRLIIVHSTEFYASLNINHSPLTNVGLVLDLPEWNQEQVQHFVQISGLDFTETQIQELFSLLNGHPMLVRVGCDYIKLYDITLPQFLAIAPTLQGAYKSHLIERLNLLKSTPDLKAAFHQVVNSEYPIKLEPNIARYLQCLGLVKLEGNFSKSFCELYRIFFREHL